MAEIGLFPLELVLLPTEQVPLHVFEPRYRELIGECLETDGEFGIVLEDEHGLREVGTLAAVTEVLTRFPDGRLNVVVEGRDRFLLLAETEGRSFRTAVVEPYSDADAGPAEPEDVARAEELFRTLVELTGAGVEVPGSSPAPRSFVLAARFDLAPATKQQLLEERSERVRMRQLCKILEREAVALRRARENAERAATNGKVERRDA
jgi:ATP-dependent Lon protease